MPRFRERHRRRDLALDRQQASEEGGRASGARPQHHRSNQIGPRRRHLLGNGTPEGETDYAHVGDLERLQQPHSVRCHLRHGVGTSRPVTVADSTIVKCDDLISGVTQNLGAQEFPVRARHAGATNEEDGIAFARHAIGEPNAVHRYACHCHEVLPV